MKEKNANNNNDPYNLNRNSRENNKNYAFKLKKILWLLYTILQKRMVIYF